MTQTLRRTRIVCTLGPATASDERIKELATCGMDVARLNFSHGEHTDHAANFDRVRKAAVDTGRTIGIMADLQGPKIRLGRFAEGSTMWNVGEEVRITVEPCSGTHDRVSTTYDQLADDAKAGDRFLIDDGRIALDVIAIDGPDVVCRVLVGGPVSDNKGLSLPGVNVSVPALSAKDIADLEFALDLGVDFVALSFVRSPRDIEPVHRVMDRLGRRVPVIAKLEKPEAVEHLEAIVAAFDAVMVARGDLGVEVPLEQVPLVQKDAIQLARESAKPVIVATQMLDSMIENARPTRAEASDVANAVLDGADAVMLSGETSVGKYVFDTVSTMDRIITAVEGRSTSAPPLTLAPRTRPGIIVSAALDVAERLDAAAIVAFTQSGDTVRRLARLHTDLPLLAFTPCADVQRQLSLTWGTEAFLVDPVESTDDMVFQVDRALLELGRFERGDTVVIVAGSPPNTVGSTNLVHIHRLGENDR